MPALDVVIVTWNNERHLGACLDSLARDESGNFRLQKVVVVDNASRDGSAALAQSFAGRLPIEVMRLDSNQGFARACNVGARASSAEYVLFLNPDTRLTERSLSAPIAELERPERAGVAVCGIQLLDARGDAAHSASAFPTLGMFLSRSLGLSRLAPGLFPASRLPPGAPASSGYVDQVAGAFFLVRRHAFEALDGFDERFFLYFEELDLSLRLSRQGWKSYFLKEASAVHLGHGSSAQVKSLRLFYSLRSRILYACKHFAPPTALAVAAVTCAVEPLARIAGSLVTLSPGQALETLRAYGLLFADLPGMLRTARRG